MIFGELKDFPGALKNISGVLKDYSGKLKDFLVGCCRILGALEQFFWS